VARDRNDPNGFLLRVRAAAATAVDAAEFCAIGEHDLSEEAEWPATCGCTHRHGDLVTGFE